MSKLRYKGPARPISTEREVLTDFQLLWCLIMMAFAFVFIVFVMEW